MTNPLIAEFVELERQSQPAMDRFYRARGHRIVSRRGTKQYDVILDVFGDPNRRELVEEKYRTGHKYNDVLIELIQDVASGELGWFFHTGCDTLHYIWCGALGQPIELQRIKWNPFKDWFLGYLGYVKKHTAIVSERGWGITLNVAVPLNVIPTDLIEVYDLGDDA